MGHSWSSRDVAEKRRCYCWPWECAGLERRWFPGTGLPQACVRRHGVNAQEEKWKRLGCSGWEMAWQYVVHLLWNTAAAVLRFQTSGALRGSQFDHTWHSFVLVCENLSKACMASILHLAWHFSAGVMPVPLNSSVSEQEDCGADVPEVTVLYGYSGCCFTWLACRPNQELWLEQVHRKQGLKIICVASSC